MKPADAILALFRQGKDTLQIANELGMSESGVYNSLHTAREADRARKRWQAKYHANWDYLKLRRCGFPREYALEVVGGWRTPTRSERVGA